MMRVTCLLAVEAAVLFELLSPAAAISVKPAGLLGPLRGPNASQSSFVEASNNPADSDEDGNGPPTPPGGAVGGPTPPSSVPSLRSYFEGLGGGAPQPAPAQPPAPSPGPAPAVGPLGRRALGPLVGSMVRDIEQREQDRRSAEGPPNVPRTPGRGEQVRQRIHGLVEAGPKDEKTRREIVLKEYMERPDVQQKKEELNKDAEKRRLRIGDWIKQHKSKGL
ncbi:hypothetical protein cyc_07850 [Cyclospora cayetanensis]|uniref:Uncharacterized protein n=1 Tax=Cyclospora cayetanensis TaxID=88456 RepID=A0A1D3CZF9_9EIME|nr:hypothetical protein cyc_07850 [Cyclospora cayetanensis]